MIGVDPHKAWHTAVAISAAEEPLGELRVRACAAQAGRLLAQQLLAAGDTSKNDPGDARSVAVAALRSAGVREVGADDHAALLKIWSKRYRDLGRTQVVCRLHAVLCELVPGGVPGAGKRPDCGLQRLHPRRHRGVPACALGQPAGLSQQVTNGDLSRRPGVSHPEPRDVPLDRRIQVHLPGLGQLHDRRRREGLRNQADEKRRLRRERPPRAVSPAEASQVNALPVPDDPERQARDTGGLHLRPDIRIHRGKPGRRAHTADRTRRRLMPFQQRPQAFPAALMTCTPHRHQSPRRSAVRYTATPRAGDRRWRADLVVCE
jgi:hypothetical protein